MNYLQAHWQGHQSFKQTFLLNTAAPIAVLLIVQHLIVEPLVVRFEPLRLPTLFIMAALYLAIILASAVSINRSHRISGSLTYGGGYSVMFCNTCIFLTVCLVAVNLVDLRTIGIIAPTTIKQAFTPVELNTNEDNTRIFLSGEINPFTPDRLEAFIADNRNANTLVLNSSGGHIYAARAIALLLQRQRLNTHVDEHCHSACTLIFISGTKRTMSNTASLGFHGYQYLAEPTVYNDVDSQQQKDAVLFSDQGVTDKFIQRIYTTPSDDLWQPTLEELITAGVVTQ